MSSVQSVTHVPSLYLGVDLQNARKRRVVHGYDATWAFLIRPVGSMHTRLIQRFRFGTGPQLLGTMFYTALIEIPHFVMERKMLLGIRAGAERAYAESKTAEAAA
jgi:hypothetical protein